MTGNAIPEALKPFAKIAEFFADEQEWRDHDTIMVAPMENLREAQHLTVGDLRRARTAYDAIGSGVKALEWGDDEFPQAECSFGIYQIVEPVEGGFIATRSAYPFHEDVSETLPTVAQAKAAAQADFERRVLSCLSAVAVEEADAKAAALYGPYGWIIKPVGLAEDEWELEADPEEDTVNFVSIPLYTKEPQRLGITALSTHTAAGAGPVGEAVADEGWQPIETAPTGGKFGCFLMLAFGPPGDQTVSEGMHFQGRFYAASVFYTGGPHDTKQFTFREHEVKPTHWRHTLAAPGTARPIEEPAGPVGEAVADAEAERLHEAWGEFETDYDLVREGHPHIHYRQCRAAFESAWPDAKKATANAAALLAARPIEEPGEAVAWRDMTSAPKDGTVIWLYQPHDVGGFMFAGAINADGVWINNLDLKVQDPTHWMPLPANPGSVRPVEEPGEVERKLAFVRSALNEKRYALRQIAGEDDDVTHTGEGHARCRKIARAALTGDAQEGGK